MQDPSEAVRIPAAKLFLAAAPAPVALAIWIIGLQVGVQWNVHGRGMILLMLIPIAGVVGFLVEATLVPTSLVRLNRYPALRTPLNIASVAVGTFFLLFAVPWIAWWLFT